MEMIWHQTPCNSRSGGGKESFIKIEKNQIILSLKENSLPVISLIVNMVNIIRDERHAVDLI